MYLFSWRLCYDVDIFDLVIGPVVICWYIIDLLDNPGLMTNDENCVLIWLSHLWPLQCLSFLKLKLGAKQIQNIRLHRNPVMNVLLPLNLLMQSPLPKLLAVTTDLSLFFFFRFLPESASSSFGGSRTKTNDFSDFTWSRSWLREWWLIANLTYRGCQIPQHQNIRSFFGDIFYG